MNIYINLKRLGWWRWWRRICCEAELTVINIASIEEAKFSAL